MNEQNKQIYLTPRVDLGVMAMKEYSIFSRIPLFGAGSSYPSAEGYSQHILSHFVTATHKFQFIWPHHYKMTSRQILLGEKLDKFIVWIVRRGGGPYSN